MAEHGYPNRAGPASFHLGTEPSTTRVNIPVHVLTGAFHCTDNGPVEDSCDSLSKSAIFSARDKSVLFDILDVSTRGSEFTGPINRIFDPINHCNCVHVRTDVIPSQVKWPNKMTDPLNRRPNKADSTVRISKNSAINLCKYKIMRIGQFWRFKKLCAIVLSEKFF